MLQTAYVISLETEALRYEESGRSGKRIVRNAITVTAKPPIQVFCKRAAFRHLDLSDEASVMEGTSWCRNSRNWSNPL